MGRVIKEQLIDLALHEYWDAVTAKIPEPKGLAVLTKDGAMISGGPLRIKAYDPEAVMPKTTWQTPPRTKEYIYPAAEVLNAALISHLCKNVDERPLPKLRDILEAAVIVTPHKGTKSGYAVKTIENPAGFSGLVDPPSFPL